MTTSIHEHLSVQTASNEKLTHIEVILPVYNEYSTIPLLLKQLDATAKKIGHEARVTYLFVNDGSNDGTQTLLDTLFETRKDIRVVHLLHNFGHGAAIACGLDHFNADVALLMDADLQDPPEALLEMFGAWKKGAKTVVAERAKRSEKTGFLFNLFYFLLRKTAPELPPINFGTHSLLDSSVVNRLATLKEKNRYYPGLLGFSSTQITSVPIHRRNRVDGRSRVGFFGLLNLAVTALLSFSPTPVRLVSILGLMASMGAILGGSIIVGIKIFTEKAIPGWASTMSLLFFGTGLQLLCLGIIGEYIARIYQEVKGRPLYLVGSILEKRETPSNS